MTALVIIAILAVLVYGVVGHLRGRARRGQCMANLRALHTAAELHRQQHGSWPQIRRKDYADPQAHANAWIDAFTAYGVQRSTWICPSVQELVDQKDYSKPENARLDYVAMPFDDKPLTPHQWARQPWFIEVGDVHGSGNLMIFPDGSISDLKSVAGGG
jgi:type II secretory pathway pseudopilin PulG